jgi:hypothetical protein
MDNNSLTNINISIIREFNYVTPIKYVSGRIVEYDIASANITMLRKYNVISEDEYQFLSKLPKHDREVKVGIMQRDNRIYQIISEGIKKAKEELMILNNIDPNSIVRVANDAVYINSSIDLAFTEFGGVRFRPKSINSCLIQLNKLLVFCNCTNGIDIDIKGLSDDAQLLHVDYMLSFIGNIIYLMERVSLEEALKEVTLFYQDYVNLNLPIGYYRELNSYSGFRIALNSFVSSDYLVSNIDTVKDVSIDYNLYIIRELWSIVLDKYYERKK